MFHINVLQQCKANNRKAQLKLYRQYCDGMFLVAYRYVKNEKDAEDVLQDAMLKAFRNLDIMVIQQLCISGKHRCSIDLGL